MDFGFSLSPSSAVNLDTVDLALFRKVEARCPDIRTCIGCGSCSATCMASAWSGMSVRQVILALQRDALPQVEKKLSACMLCGKCTMVCPRGINTRNLILSVSRECKKEEGKR